MAEPLPERSAVADDTAATLELRATAGDDFYKEVQFAYVHRDPNVDPPSVVEAEISLDDWVLQSSIWTLGDMTAVESFDIDDLPSRGSSWAALTLPRDRTALLTPGTYGYAVWADDTDTNRSHTYIRGTLTILERP